MQLCQVWDQPLRAQEAFPRGLGAGGGVPAGDSAGTGLWTAGGGEPGLTQPLGWTQQDTSQAILAHEASLITC